MIKNSLLKIGHVLGAFWTCVLLTIFYMSIFGLFALCMKIARRDPLRMKKRLLSTWQPWEKVGLKEDWYRPF